MMAVIQNFILLHFYTIVTVVFVSLLIKSLLN